MQKTKAELNKERRVQQLKDRRDYRQSLIHRRAYAQPDRGIAIDAKIATVEAEIRKLEGK